MAKEEQSVGELPPEEPEREARPEGTYGVGALLQASRLRCGEDLRYVSDMLHIRYLYLEAIEDGRFQDLPGPTYTIGFIRAYADHLGLDSDEVVRRLKEETSGSTGRSELDFPVPIPESVVPGGAILLVGIVLAILAYGGWYVSSSNDMTISELASPLPDRFLGLLAKDKPALPDSKDIETEAPAVSRVDEIAPVRSSDNPTAAPLPEPVSPEKPDAPKPETSTTAPTNDVPDAGAKTTDAGAKTTDAVAKTTDAVAKTTDAGATTKNKIDDTADGQADVTDSNVSSVGDSSSSKVEPSKETADVAEVAVAATADATTAAEKKPVVAEPVPEPPTNAVEDSAPSSSPSSGDSSPSTPDTPAPTPSSAPDTATALEPAPDVAVSDIPAARTYGLENSDSRITLRAKANSWIQVRDDIAGQLLLTRLLRRGDSYRVPNRPGLKLLTGNAGALDILIDGEVIPSIGATGVVRRGVALDVDLLRQGTDLIE